MARPILYMSYVRSWFHDLTNFKAPQTNHWDTLGLGDDGAGAAEAPYETTIMDSRTNQATPEEWVTAHGGDVGAMRSASYTQRGI